MREDSKKALQKIMQQNFSIGTRSNLEHQIIKNLLNAPNNSKKNKNNNFLKKKWYINVQRNASPVINHTPNISNENNNKKDLKMLNFNMDINNLHNYSYTIIPTMHKESNLQKNANIPSHLKPRKIKNEKSFHEVQNSNTSKFVDDVYTIIHKKSQKLKNSENSLLSKNSYDSNIGYHSSNNFKIDNINNVNNQIKSNETLSRQFFFKSHQKSNSEYKLPILYKLNDQIKYQALFRSENSSGKSNISGRNSISNKSEIIIKSKQKEHKKLTGLEALKSELLKESYILKGKETPILHKKFPWWNKSISYDMNFYSDLDSKISKGIKYINLEMSEIKEVDNFSSYNLNKFVSKNSNSNHKFLKSNLNINTKSSGRFQPLNQTISIPIDQKKSKVSLEKIGMNKAIPSFRIKGNSLNSPTK